MLKTRVIGCLVIKNNLVVQSIGFKKYLPIGKPEIAVEYLCKWDVDEIVIIDIDATKECRCFDLETLSIISKNCRVPLTVGGGIKSIDDIYTIIRNGADKVCINNAAYQNIDFIKQASSIYGAQCIVVSIDVKRSGEGEYYVYTNNGKDSISKKPEEWAKKLEEFGAGEILLNSIDRDGSKKGFDIEIIKKVSSTVNIPVIALGGAGKFSDFAIGVLEGGASAIAASNIFHFVEHATIIAKSHLTLSDIDVRHESVAQYDHHTFDSNGRLLKLKTLDTQELQFDRFEKEVI